MVDVVPDMHPDEDDGSLKLQTLAFEKTGEALLSGGSGIFTFY